MSAIAFYFLSYACEMESESPHRGNPHPHHSKHARRYSFPTKRFRYFYRSRLETRRIAVPDRRVAQLTGVCTPWVRADMDVDSVASIVVDAGNKGSLALAKHHLQICSQSRWVGQHSRVGRESARIRLLLQEEAQFFTACGCKSRRTGSLCGPP